MGQRGREGLERPVLTGHRRGLREVIVNGGRGLTESPMTPVGFAMAAGYWVVVSWQGTGRRQVLGGG